MDDKQKMPPDSPARQAAGNDADARMRRQQDLAADILQLKEALRDARLLAEESQVRCEALDQERRDALAGTEAAQARVRALQEEFEALRRQFESRIVELRDMLDALRPHEDDASHRSPGTA